MASVRKNSSSKSPFAVAKRLAAPANGHFAICVRNDDYPASLELRKLYPVLKDEFADKHGMVRVIDESGEDYLFPEDYFVSVELPLAVKKKLQKIA
jgi:hypothetical protein